MVTVRQFVWPCTSYCSLAYHACDMWPARMQRMDFEDNIMQGLFLEGFFAVNVLAVLSTSVHI